MPPRTRRRLHPGPAAAKSTTQLNVSIPGEGAVPRTSTPARPKTKLSASLPIQHAAHSSLPPSSPPPPTSSLEHVYVSDIPSKDDPFGFFSAERRLKARIADKGRTGQKPDVTRDRDEDAVLTILGIQSDKNQAAHLSESDKEDEYSLDDGRPAFATPPHADGSSELELDLSLGVIVAGTKTPTAHTPDPRAVTPRQRRRKTKLPTVPISRSSSPDCDAGSYPQTPSPRKRARSTRRPLTEVKPQDNTPRKPGSKKAVGMRKTRKTDETLAEEQLGGVTKELTELLPRRTTRRAAQQKSTVPAKGSTTGAAPKKSGKGSKPRSKKAVNERNTERELVGEREGESFVLNGDEREQFEIDRAARQAYFRKLDDYVMEEESVYIV